MGAEPIVGIDLGTTNSEIAIVRDGRPHVFSVDGDPILPSFVGLSADGRMLVGKAAKNQWVAAHDRTIKSIKRKMGEDAVVRLGDADYRPQEISAIILRTLRDRAAKELGCDVRKAVITVPAFFNDAQRQATREAGELAGLEVVRILNEPTAASLCYGPKEPGLRRLLVYDLGGGTFDVSVVAAQDGVFEVLASHGDTKLGGDDFDDLLAGRLADGFREKYDIDLRADLAAKARLMSAAEAAKRHLSFHPFVQVKEEFIARKSGNPLHLDVEVGRDEYEDLIAPLIERTMECVRRALEDAKLSARQIDDVILVGGSTRTPLVGRLLEERFDRTPRQEVDPDLCVAMGAAVQAAIIGGADVGAVLVDITPHSLGIRALVERFGRMDEHHFAPIIRRNTPLPAGRSEAFFTMYDNQKSVEVEVFQGESADIRRNHLVGNFRIEGLAAVPEGNEIVVRLDLNLDGMLKVSAVEKATGLRKQITVQNALAKPAAGGRDGWAGESRRRLDELWAEGAEDSADEDDDEGGDGDGEFGGEDGEDGDPALARGEAGAGGVPSPASATASATVAAATSAGRETVSARALLEKAERLQETAPAEDRADLQRLMDAVRAALTDGRSDRIASASGELADVLFYLEG